MIILIQKLKFNCTNPPLGFRFSIIIIMICPQRLNAKQLLGLYNN